MSLHVTPQISLDLAQLSDSSEKLPYPRRQLTRDDSRHTMVSVASSENLSISVPVKHHVSLDPSQLSDSKENVSYPRRRLKRDDSRHTMVSVASSENLSVPSRPRVSVDLSHEQSDDSRERPSWPRRQLNRDDSRHTMISVASSDWTRQTTASVGSNWTRPMSSASNMDSNWTRPISSASNWTGQPSVSIPVPSYNNRIRSANTTNQRLILSNRRLSQQGTMQKVQSRPSSVVSLEVKSRPSTSTSIRRRRLNSKDIVHHLFEIWIPQLSDSYRPFAYFVPVPESTRSASRCSEHSEKSVSEARTKFKALESVVEICNRVGNGAVFSPKA